MFACALAVCGGASDEPPPSFDPLAFPEIPHEFPPFIDEEVGRVSAEVVSLESELAEAEAEIERLKDELSAEKKAAKVAKTEKASSETFEATYYSAFCDTGCIGVTATGIDVSSTIYHAGKRIVAVDPSVIPLDSTVRVTLEDGNSFEATAQDTGGDIRGKRVDILVGSTEEAYKLGRHGVEIEIIEKGR